MDEHKISESINKLFKTSTNNYIFIYTPPKVGSTTLVTSLRVSLNKSYNIIHIHDETMLCVLTGINDVKINDIISYLSKNGKNVYVIDVYRTPIERKISEYFEKLSPHHFNNSDENISNYYSIKRISDRFNKIFPYIENEDHYFDKYDILEPIQFDFENKYTVQDVNNIKYIKLRLCDSSLWASILSTIFNIDIIIIDDYKTENKPLGYLYNKFKNEYKIPSNYIEIIKNDKHFNFYYNENERIHYLNYWNSKLCEPCIPYKESEFKFYMNLCLENQFINDIQIDHYIDNGCFCKLCTDKRRDIYFKYKKGERNFEKIIHNEVINEFKTEKINKINQKLKNIVENKIAKNKYKPKQFKINMSK
jgi:hypothetical protein